MHRPIGETKRAVCGELRAQIVRQRPKRLLENIERADVEIAAPRTHANTLGRLNIRVATGYEADAEKVIEILKACVAEHPGVLKQPPPAVLLAEFGATAMTFDIFCVVPNLGERGQIKSDIQIAILRRFRAAGIAVAAAGRAADRGRAPGRSRRKS